LVLRVRLALLEQLVLRVNKEWPGLLVLRDHKVSRV
jgi:hypothetical protein